MILLSDLVKVLPGVCQITISPPSGCGNAANDGGIPKTEWREGSSPQLYPLKESDVPENTEPRAGSTTAATAATAAATTATTATLSRPEGTGDAARVSAVNPDGA